MSDGLKCPECGALVFRAVDGGVYCGECEYRRTGPQLLAECNALRARLAEAEKERAHTLDVINCWLKEQQLGEQRPGERLSCGIDRVCVAKNGKLAESLRKRDELEERVRELENLIRPQTGNATD